MERDQGKKLSHCISKTETVMIKICSKTLESMKRQLASIKIYYHLLMKLIPTKKKKKKNSCEKCDNVFFLINISMFFCIIFRGTWCNQLNLNQIKQTALKIKYWLTMKILSIVSFFHFWNIGFQIKILSEMSIFIFYNWWITAF